MSGRRKHGVPARGPRLSDGSEDMIENGTPKSRRSSRHRIQSKKPDANVAKSENQASTESGPDLRNDSNGTQYRTRGAVAGAGDSSEKIPAKIRPGSNNSKDDQNHRQILNKPKQDVDKETDEISDSFISLIEESALDLLRLDQQTYQEYILMDADLLLKKIFLPMCFPWCHKSTLTVKNMARDIDELPALMTEGQTCEGTMMSGKPVKSGKDPAGRDVLLMSRTEDPGIVKLTRQVTPPIHIFDIERKQNCFRPNTAGQVKLFSFREAVRSRKDTFRKPTTKAVKLISFRFGETSSRSSLFPKVLCGKKRPMLLQASFSEDFQRGKRLQTEKANEIARELGSYDYRFGLPILAHSSNRTRAGRTRLIWSTKQITGQRPVYRSMINGVTLENGKHKRPIENKVGIRVNNKLLCIGKHDSFDEAERAKGSKYTDEEVELALSDVFKTKETTSDGSKDQNSLARQLLQCSLNTDNERFISSMAKNLADTRKHIKAKNIVMPSIHLQILPPATICHPTEDGVIRTLCLAPGQMSNAEIGSISDDPPEVDASAFLREVSQKFMACSVCWSTDTEKEDIYLCSGCGLRAHISCHPGDNQNPSKANPTWKCNSCKLNSLPDQQKNARLQNRRCEVCPVVGGPMSLYDSKWLHDVCYAWCSSSAGGGEIGQCVICSGTKTKVIKCAARGCSLKFHPMCGVLVSKLAQVHRRPASTPQVTQKVSPRKPNTKLESNRSHGKVDRFTNDIKEADCLQSTQYELVATKIQVHGRKHFVNLGFCGLHNRHRLPEFYGLFPGGSTYDDSFRVPPLQEL